MTRTPPVDPEKLGPQQRAVYDAIVATRGGTLGGPFAIWIRNPNLAAAAARLGDSLRLEGKLDPKLFEMIVLIVARQWSANYEWFAHAKDAARVGLDPAIVEAIRVHRVPPFASQHETIVYETVRELVETRNLSDASYDRAVASFGVDLVMEIVTTTGFYTLVAMMLKAFDAQTPGGARPFEAH